MTEEDEQGYRDIREILQPAGKSTIAEEVKRKFQEQERQNPINPYLLKRARAQSALNGQPVLKYRRVSEFFAGAETNDLAEKVRKELQAERAKQTIDPDRIRQDQDWSYIAKQVVGGEIGIDLTGCTQCRFYDKCDRRKEHIRNR